MKTIFYNSAEERLRAFWRILLVALLIFLIYVFWSIAAQTMAAAISGLAVISVSIIWYVCRVIDKRPFTEMGFTLNINWIRDFIAGVSIAGFTICLMVLAFNKLGYLTISVMYTHPASTDFLITLLSTLILMTAVSVWEEIFFRAYLITNLTEGFKLKPISQFSALLIAVLLSSVMFAFAHTNNPGSSYISFINITVAGIVLAYPYIFSKSLAISVGLHLSWNYFQGVIFGLPVSGLEMNHTFLRSRISGPEFLTGSQFGPEGGAIGLFGLILMALLCSIYLHKIYKK